MPVDESLASDQWNAYTYARDRGHIEFLKKAHKCDEFYIGNQWLQSDLTTLEDQQRPALTINKILSTIGTIQGEQIQNRTEVLFRPSSGAPAQVAEILSKVWMNIGQSNQLPWVRSDVFADGIIRGRGFYDVRMNFDDNVFGDIQITQLNSKNVIIDNDAEEYDPDKWNRVFVTKWFTPNDIAVLYNKADAELLELRGATTRFGYDSLDMVRDTFGTRNIYLGSGDAPQSEMAVKNLRNIRVIDQQYRKLHKQTHFVDMETGDMRPVPEGWNRDRIAAFLEKVGPQITTTKKLVRRIRWTVTADDIVLHDDWSPYNHFTVVPYFPHFRYGKTVGIVENLLGSQEILNKVSSQELHIVNTTANSGYIVEEDSLVNLSTEELEADGAKTGLVIEYRKGAQPPVKIQPNQPPSGLDRISEKSEQHIKTISGVSDSMQGFDRADVAAKAIAYKRQSGSVSMSKVLDNLERTDWLLARNVLDLIQTFYTNERVLNITHDDFRQEQEEITVNQTDPYTGVVTNDLTIGEYDIVVTSSPYRASLEDSQFEQAKALREIGVPIPDSVLIENSRLLRRSEIVKEMTAQANSPQAKQQAELNMRGLAADVALKEANVEKTHANAQMLTTKTAVDAQKAQAENPEAELALEAHKAKQEQELEERKVSNELELEQYKFDKQMELDRYKFEKELELKREQMAREAAQRRVDSLRSEGSEEAAETH